LRAYLRASNGGEIELAGDLWQVHPVLDTSDRKHAARSASHIARETEFARGWGGFPPAAVSIASNGSGDRLILTPSSADPSLLDSAIHRWDHETGLLSLAARQFPVP